MKYHRAEIKEYDEQTASWLGMLLVSAPAVIVERGG